MDFLASWNLLDYFTLEPRIDRATHVNPFALRRWVPFFEAQKLQRFVNLGEAPGFASAIHMTNRGPVSLSLFLSISYFYLLYMYVPYLSRSGCVPATQ